MSKQIFLKGISNSLTRFPKSHLKYERSDGNVQTVSFLELHDKIEVLKRNILASGFRDKDRIGLLTSNSIEFVMWDIAAIDLGLLLISFTGDNLPDGNIDNLIKLHQLRVLVTDKKEYLLEPNTHAISNIDKLIVSERMAKGEHDDDDHSIVFSSGTTGELKGIRISTTGTEYIINNFIKSYRLSENDSHLIFLPMSNYQQRMSIYGCLAVGVDIVICDYASVFKAINKHHPSFLIAPPVFYETCLQIVNNQADKLASVFGTNMRFMITGMAPISNNTLHIYQEANLCLVEAYGLTETGMISWNLPDDNKIGTVGRPLDSSHIEIQDDGEIRIQRPFPLSNGYYLASEESIKNTFLLNSIIATGDIGSFDADGYLQLSGRKKDIIIFNNGIKVSPIELEQKLQHFLAVDNPIIIYDTTTDRLALVIKCGDSNRKVEIETKLRDFNNKVEQHIRIRRIHWTDDDVTSNERYLTRNMKLMRSKIALDYQVKISSVASV